MSDPYERVNGGRLAFKGGDLATRKSIEKKKKKKKKNQKKNKEKLEGAKKFCYIPKSNFESVAEALEDRVKKKADRYCK
ncbi:hypothetical protein N665_0028s0010 [Sinapis alba]|nr:hypothetical protein N665_0028s0010 [Sinapis alba]